LLNSSKRPRGKGLYVLLRPGLYICGEVDWSDFPSLLSEIPGMIVRSDSEAFLKQTSRYLANLAETAGLANLQIPCGGPILIVQVDNEYGSYGENYVVHRHITTSCGRSLRSRFIQITEVAPVRLYLEDKSG
jgi:beta-galactosidase GanA